MSSLEICTFIPFSKNCSLLSPLPNSFPSPTAFSLSPIRRPQLHLRSPLLPPLSAANISTNTEKEDLLLGEIQEDSENDEEELEEEWSSDEEPERFDVQEFEREAKQVVKDFSVSLSRELRIEDDVSNQKETRGKQKRRTNTGSNIPDHLLPRVAIVGRPNVGKSALFNRLVGGNKAIVVDEPGVTRDRLYGRSYWGDYEFMVVDTGGVLTISKSQDDVMEELAISTTIGMEGIPLASREAAVARMPSMVERQATVAVEESSVIIFLVDGQVWYSPLPISAISGSGTGELLDSVCSQLKKLEETENHIEEYVPAVAIVGRPNVDGQKFRLIDTAGIRKRAAVASSGSTTEALSVNRAFRAVRRSDVVALVIEAMACITEQDFKIAERIEKEGKGCLIVVNKWDTIPNKNQQTAMHYEEDVRGKLRILSWAPIVYSTAIQGQSVEKHVVVPPTACPSAQVQPFTFLPRSAESFKTLSCSIRSLGAQECKPSHFCLGLQKGNSRARVTSP
ncbi:UNVERIFIED_CONTAM: GTPase Der [Sesamum angustifolium]|uniref:GTPase Der n=1 Tax=Sesamum angustifolium TaxID=2727405 RepID=A0AAW2QRE5_9LAMI